MASLLEGGEESSEFSRQLPDCSKNSHFLICSKKEENLEGREKFSHLKPQNETQEAFFICSQTAAKLPQLANSQQLEVVVETSPFYLSCKFLSFLNDAKSFKLPSGQDLTVATLAALCERCSKCSSASICKDYFTARNLSLLYEDCCRSCQLVLASLAIEWCFLEHLNFSSLLITNSSATLQRRKVRLFLKPANESSSTVMDYSNLSRPCISKLGMHNYAHNVSGQNYAPDGRFGSVCTPHIFQLLIREGICWCRFCGTTRGVNWRPGPWGPKTLCNRHGCDYKGYGFAAHHPKLNLSEFSLEALESRKIPVLKEYCYVCLERGISVASPNQPEGRGDKSNYLVMCHGCSCSFHERCVPKDRSIIPQAAILGQQPWFCLPRCVENMRCCSVEADIPKHRLLPFSIVHDRSLGKASAARPSPLVTASRKRRHSSSGLPAIPRHQACAFGALTSLSMHNIPTPGAQIQVPRWRQFTASAAPAFPDPLQIEDISDSAYLLRHLKYETLEKENSFLFLAPKLRESSQ